MSEIDCLAVLTVALTILVVAVIVGCGWLLVRYSRESMRTLAQADESRSAAWSLTERALSRITAIHFPQSHAGYRRAVGAIDGAQQHPKPQYVDELEAGLEHVNRVNGNVPVVEAEMEEQE